MQKEWLTVEQYRIHVMQLWPDGDRKEASLAAARMTLKSLARAMPEGSLLADFKPRFDLSAAALAGV
jgi:hypothetical protein